jgi:hypothetical protein
LVEERGSRGREEGREKGRRGGGEGGPSKTNKIFLILRSILSQKYIIILHHSQQKKEIS